MEYVGPECLIVDTLGVYCTAAVLEDKCYISLQQDKTYNQKDVLYFFLMFHGQQAQVPHSSMYQHKHILTA